MARKRCQTRPRRVRCPRCGLVYTADITDRWYRTHKRTFGFPELTHHDCLSGTPTPGQPNQKEPSNG